MIKTILIDDDAINIDMLQNRLNKYCPQVDIVASATSVADGIEAILTYKPDLVFLDIEIHQQTGFDLLDAIEDVDLNVILCTAYDKYAIESYKYSIVGYILKPVIVTELIAAVKKVEKIIDKKSTTIPVIHYDNNFNNNEPEYLSIHYKEHVELIKCSEIIHLEANGSYTEVYTVKNKKIISTKSLKETETALPSKMFIRVHNSHIINIHFLDKYVKSKNGSLLLVNGKDIPISASRKKEVYERLGI